ncbi:DUF4157 domain-containing protein [Porphyrobacter sp. YT40]|uniref:eCIS core domain-containing protein n=1 Tax=Porphyrobacter sp. YT40 TaxID=2547601 RepID=UPI001144930C|nr:DUF4157 domain-containing protein [Porphyrobacter sp. YT40]QDH33213.1 DUF4157 domain-containing protein [Porphyrobacter sp. YT40]
MKLRARLRSGTADVAATRAVRRAEVPHRALMIARFGRRAAHVPVFIGPAVAASLRRKQAQGAAIDGVIFLPHERVGSDLVAHELAHAMQQPEAGLGDAAPTALLERLAHAPVLPEHSRAEAAADQAAEGAGPVDLTATPVAPGVAALRRTVPEGETTSAEPPVPTRSEEPARSDASAPSGSAGAASPEAAAPAAGDTDIAPTFTPPEFVEPTIDPALAAQRAAEAAAAQEAMANAESPAGVMDAYATMAPSQKAAAMGGLQGRLEASNVTAHGKLAEATPAITVETGGEDTALPLPPPITVPTDAPDITPADAAAPTVDVPAPPEQPTLAVPPTFNHEMERHFNESATPERVDDQIDAVATGNPGIQTAVTDRAGVPRDGANDPERLDDAQTQQREAASTQRQEAAAAVVNGPGPETIMPRALAAEAPAPEMTAATTAPITPAPEAEKLQTLALPEAVVADFDAATGADMAASTAAARDQMQTAEAERQTAHDTAVAQAETDRVAAEQQADQQQRDAITEQRQVIQDERQRTVDDQNTAMAEVNGQAAQARDAKRAEAETEVRNAETAIDARYDEAETEARAKVAEGERKAEAERERKRREAENQSWWERAAGWIADAFEALVSLVNGIFDLVRSAITGLIELARTAVTALIDLASRALQALVSALGELLKGLIDGLIGEIFPELAARLTAAIDSAVAVVNSAIDAVANALIAGVNAIAAALTSAVNAILDAYQAAFNAAAAVLQAAISGDWGALLRQVLDAVLRVLGIDPAAFHALIAQASEAIDIIVNDPGAFVGNMISALVGGVERFADNFGTHLRRGLIGWLTGALGDIQIPDEWNLWTVLDLVRQIMGLTWDFVRERAARLIGPENVARLEMMASWIGTLITEGWQGLWTRVQESLASLRDSVMESIRNFLIERVVMASISWLAGLFNPVGALVKLVMTIWNIYQFVSAQLQRLMGIAQAVVASISNIAHGVLDPAKQRVEEVLGNLVPVVIDLLMSLLGVTGVAARVRQIITDLRQRIADAVDRMLERVLTTLGLRRGAAGGADAAAGGAAAAGAAGGPIGHPVRVDVAEGEDHTLSIDRTGPGGATVMLRSDPRPLGAWLDTLQGLADAQENRTKKRAAQGAIRSARTILNRLEPLADAEATRTTRNTGARPASGRAATPAAAPAGAATEVVSLEDQLGPLLVTAFNNVDMAAASGAFLERYAADIARAHPQAQEMIRRDLRENAATLQNLRDWAAVSTRIKTSNALFLDPLESSRTFGGLARTALENAVAPADAALKPRIVTLCRQNVRDGAGGPKFAALKAALHTAILENHNMGSPSGALATALTQAAAEAATTLNASGDVDGDLRTQITNMGLHAFLLAMGNNQTVGTITPARFDELWKAPGGANKEFITSRFRVPTGMHEWIPTNYIPEVLARARTAREEEGIEAATFWVKLHTEWRTPTELLIYKPSTGTRSITVAGRRVTVLQGHVGSVYAPADDAGATATPQQQTIGQGPWHDRLREIFDANKSVGGTSKAAVEAVITQIRTFANSTVWRGEASAAIDAYDEYFSTNSASASRIGLSGVRTNAGRAAAQMDIDFQTARNVLGRAA